MGILILKQFIVAKQWIQLIEQRDILIIRHKTYWNKISLGQIALKMTPRENNKIRMELITRKTSFILKIKTLYYHREIKISNYPIMNNLRLLKN